MLRDLLHKTCNTSRRYKRAVVSVPAETRHQLTVPSNHQREENARKHKTLRFQHPLPRFKTCGAAKGGAFAAETARARQGEL